MEIYLNHKPTYVGTLDWFEDFMSESDLVIKEIVNGIPGLFLHHKDDMGRDCYHFLCRKDLNDGYYDDFNKTADGYICVFPSTKLSENGLFDFPLSQQCEKAVDKMILEAKNLFKKWWENDGVPY